MTVYGLKNFGISRGDTVHKIDKKIDYIIGSGHHTNSHLLKLMVIYIKYHIHTMPRTGYLIFHQDTKMVIILDLQEKSIWNA